MIAKELSENKETFQKKIFILLRLEKITKNKSDYKFGQAIIDQILPLMKDVYSLYFKSRTNGENVSTLKRQSFNEKCFNKNEEDDVFFRTYYFGGAIPYFAYNEYSFDVLRNKLDRNKQITYGEFLLDFENTWNFKRDFFKKKILYIQQAKERKKQHQNIAKFDIERLTRKNELRDLKMLSIKMDQAEISFFKQNKEIKNWIFTRKKIEHAIKMIVQYEHEELYKLTPVNVSIDIDTDNTDDLCVIVEWSEEIFEYLVLHRFNKKN